jgi:stearoyl-CoA desaturase (delta-9 desaturase)
MRIHLIDAVITESPGKLIPKLSESERRIDWPTVLWISLMHVGVLAAPFTFSWSGLALVGLLYWLTGGIGICLCYHRLLTHRSFQLVKPLEYLFTFLGGLATQGGALSWVGWHRMHHQFSDEPSDPHSPRDGHLWSHMLWLFTRTKESDGMPLWQHYVPDLLKDPIHRLLHHTHFWSTLVLAGGMYAGGWAWGGHALGISWLVWGLCVRTVCVYHSTWLVNWASHVWGYRNFPTRDESRNNWWVALLSFGEGWHNNHHAHQRSARHGMRWCEIDVTYWTIRVLEFFRLAKNLEIPKDVIASIR